MTAHAYDDSQDRVDPPEPYDPPTITEIGSVDDVTLGVGTTVVDSPAGSGV